MSGPGKARIEGIRRRLRLFRQGDFEIPDPAVRDAATPTPIEAMEGRVAQRFPPGHFYSPLPDTRELGWQPKTELVWPETPRRHPGIDMREDEQVAFCHEVLARQERIEFERGPGDDPSVFYIRNGQFPVIDAWVLEGMLRHHRPRRMVEIGSGHSSRVTARVNREHLGGELRFTCVDPHPPETLTALDGVTEVRMEMAQRTPPEVFDALGDGDVLFVDSSHVAKTGSDVVWIYEEILPRLAPGVIVHIHDMFIPGEYPMSWVLDGWGWNELYLARAFLAFNSAFRIELNVHWLLTERRDALTAAVPMLASDELRGQAGASLWLRRVV